MGLRTRIKQQIKDRIKGIKALAFLIHEEANYPGRPQPHVAAKNPLYNGGDVEGASADSVVEETPKTEKENSISEEGDFWYLRGDDEGWSDPNPGQKR